MVNDTAVSRITFEMGDGSLKYYGSRGGAEQGKSFDLELGEFICEVKACVRDYVYSVTFITNVHDEHKYGSDAECDTKI